MKRITGIIIALLLVFSLVACSGGKEPETSATPTPSATPQSITATISVQVETDWLPYYETVKARVLAVHPGSTINFIETGAFDHLDVLDATDVTNVDVADVFAIPADRLYPLSKNEALASIDAKTMAANVGGFVDFDGGLGGNFMVDGEYLAFPMNIETLIVFANTANAAAKGIDLTGTIEFTDLEYEDMLVPFFNAWFGVAFTNAGEIELLGNDDGVLWSDMTKEYSELTANQKTVLTAIYDYWKAHDAALTDAWDTSAAWGYMDSSFSTGGKTSLRLEGPWSTNSLSEQAGGGADLAILPINQVTVGGLPLAHWKGGWGLAVNARVEGKADQMALAQAFIEEVVNTDYAVDFFKATGKILENVPVEVYTSSNLSETDKIVVASVIESYKDAPARPLFTEWGQVWSTWENALQSWSAVKPASVEAAYNEIKASFEAMMLNF
ncbi:MAG: sugar ABC transporter substrate-binding protein [Clostridia bacterium]|nr:sugar ABC transporter substrate-binding protein [Clostridia bacterium]